MVRSYRGVPALALGLVLTACSQTSPGQASTGSAATAVGPTSGVAGNTLRGGAPGAPVAGALATSSTGAGGGGASGAPQNAGVPGTVAPVAGGGAVAGASGGQSGGAAPNPSSATCMAMVKAAEEFTASLDSDMLKSAILLPFERRRNFAYEPQVDDRPGVPLMKLSAAQQEKALALLRSGLSDSGFTKAETVRKLEYLKNITMYQANLRDPGNYWVAIFGTPGVTGAWAWQWEGHHLALHYTLSDCTIADTPTFIGAWPSNVKDMIAGGPPVGTQNLQQEEEQGRALAKALDAEPERRMQAFQMAAYRQMAPEGPMPEKPLTPSGLMASGMSDAEKMQLRALLMTYASMMPAELAPARLQRIEDHGGIDQVSFVWTGALEPGQRHYYRVQGPSFMLEYRNDDGNHIHTVWRDFTGEFGDDLPGLKAGAKP